MPRSNQIGREIQHTLQNVLHPCLVRRSRAAAVLLPVRISSTHFRDKPRFQIRQPMWEDPLHNRQRHKRPGNLDERKPVGVMAGDAHNLTRKFGDGLFRHQKSDRDREETGSRARITGAQVRNFAFALRRELLQPEAEAVEV